MDEGMHVAGVEIVLFVPRSGWKHDVRVEASGTHAEIKRHQQVEFPLGCFVVPHHFSRLGVLFAHVFALHAVAGAEQVLQKIFMPFARRSQ